MGTLTNERLPPSCHSFRSAWAGSMCMALGGRGWLILTEHLCPGPRWVSFRYCHFPTTCRKHWRCPAIPSSVVTTSEPSDQMRVASSALIGFLKTS
jgi:hypothetical protein